MNAYVLDKRHSEVAGICDVHKVYVARNRTVAKVLIKTSEGALLTVSFCRACARAIANNARTVGGAS